jgi:DNA topoisomerase-3
MSRLFIFEKPDAARHVAKVLGKTGQGDGYIEVTGGDRLTWCFGHLLELEEPDFYTPDDVPMNKKGKKVWRWQELPIIPTDYRLRSKDDGTAKQIRIIQGLVKQADSIVNAGDPDREGQLIVDEVLTLIGNSKPVDRLWLNALDETSVKKSMAAIKPNKDYEGWYHAALGRQRADWLVGMNLTRAATLAASNGQVYTIGRVQTPTLRLVVERYLAIQKFKPIDYFDLSVQFFHEKGGYLGRWIAKDDQVGLDEEGRLIDPQVAQALKVKIEGKQGQIASIEQKKGRESAPLPYDLTALQGAANAKYGISSSDTLAAVQSMYEAQFVSYPRVDSRYLPNAQFADAPRILNTLKNYGIKGADVQARQSAMYNDSKVSAHHAIVPTGATPTPKNDVERKIFSLIATNYVLNFYPDFEFLTTTITTIVENETFRSTGKVPTSMGWRGAGEEVSDDEDAASDDNKALPAVAKGDVVKVQSATVSAKKTQPPKLFNDKTLLEAMANIHRYVEDARAKAQLKENEGIGTPATRANIIEELIKKNYMERKGKNISPTAAGIEVIKSYHEEVKDPILTAELERFLKEVQEGSKSLESFMEKMEAYVMENLVKLKSGKYMAAAENPNATCFLSEKQRLMLTKSEDKVLMSIAKKKTLTSDDCQKAKAYIDGIFAKMRAQQESGTRSLSDKQRQMLIKSNVSYLMEIGEKAEVTLDEFAQAKAYIDDFFANRAASGGGSNHSGGGFKLSEKQIAIVVKNAPDNIKRLTDSSKPDDLKKVKAWIDEYFSKKSK